MARYLFERVWHIPYTRVTAGEIASGALANYDVLIVTQGNPEVANNALKPAGRRALVTWLNAGGRYIGWGGGAVLAGRVGLTTDLFADAPLGRRRCADPRERGHGQSADARASATRRTSSTSTTP